MRLGLWFASLLLVSCGVSESYTSSSTLAGKKQKRKKSPAESSDTIGNQTYGKFPTNPELSVTPGELCQSPTEQRYREGINYCKRNVHPALKDEVIADYDRRFGYTVGQMQRSSFKIDHLIPLCMGGSNSALNLWPQHLSVDERTLIIEQRLCESMARGEMDQSDAVALIIEVKMDLERADEVRSELQRKEDDRKRRNY